MNVVNAGRERKGKECSSFYPKLRNATESNDSFKRSFIDTELPDLELCQKRRQARSSSHNCITKLRDYHRVSPTSTRNSISNPIPPQTVPPHNTEMSPAFQSRGARGVQAYFCVQCGRNFSQTRDLERTRKHLPIIPRPSYSNPLITRHQRKVIYLLMWCIILQGRCTEDPRSHRTPRWTHATRGSARADVQD
jgi:hypothetical protein